MNSLSYFELLKDPRWQRKRLEIMERDWFACRICGDDKTTLNVHHQFYLSKLKPWEYENDTLMTLCEPCHKFAGKLMDKLRRSLSRLDPVYLIKVLKYVDKVVASQPKTVRRVQRP